MDSTVFYHTDFDLLFHGRRFEILHGRKGCPFSPLPPILENLILPCRSYASNSRRFLESSLQLDPVFCFKVSLSPLMS